MELYQGVYLLISRGMVPSSNVMLRTLIETMFVIVAITKDDSGDALNAYILNDEMERLKMCNIVISDKKSSAILGIPVEDAKRIKKEIEIKKIKKWTTEEFARKAGLHDWYLLAYSSTSQSVHVGVRDMEHYLNLDQANEVKSIDFIPTDKGTTRILTAACGAMNIVLHAFLTALNLDTGICIEQQTMLQPFTDMALAENN
jgi:hypothetical protein